ncbi:hypothetical protein [Butyrivibrio fibrisolvens]|uniref:hypothetical protein n=1 Tax=Butyrivibrio fibrisolvens TaxID=831 RepID=UPI0003B53DA0|nr:hypothetical protein [Butyrivibrio fibrisolvens]
MDRAYYKELVSNIESLMKSGELQGRALYLFGHCDATLTMADELMQRGLIPSAILDNNSNKLDIVYEGIKVICPEEICSRLCDESAVLISTRFFETMKAQLIDLGYSGKILKMVDYNTFSEYSLSDETIAEKRIRAERGKVLLDDLKRGNKGKYIVFCPFRALGDVYICMSYLPLFLNKRNITDAIVCVSGMGAYKTAKLFDLDSYEVKSFCQQDLDAIIQAALYYEDNDTFIAHQDRPYIINLHKALYSRCIPLEKMYCCGIFGLDYSIEPMTPNKWNEYSALSEIIPGKAVILSPYAKSVISLSDSFWEDMVRLFKDREYQIFTNVGEEEKPLQGTEPISADISEMKSVVERAGLFIGLRSGLCDVLRTAKCKKIAIFPDYNYGDTKWKAIEMYSLKEFTNIKYTGDKNTLEEVFNAIS